MGRSRGVPSTGDDDTTQRSKRRRVASSGDALENISSGQGGGDGKKALYHCNYCNKDISGKIRIKCSKCPDFDLCVECFSIGAEVTPHKSNHPYRVMDNLSFPLVCSDWNADEEILLLEGIEMYGMGNWAEVAEHVGTKNKDQCIEHYNTAYMNSACYPLPDMSRVNGKNRKELLAMAKVQGDTKRGISMLGDTIVKAESPFSPTRIKLEDSIGDAATGRSPSHLTAGVSKKSLNVGQLKDASDLPKLEDVHVDRSIGVKKPKYSNEDGPSMAELSGFNSKREEFDPEYDNNAEVALAEMDFKDIDTETDREIKLRVLRIYLSRLNERKRRKEFIMERNLLYPNPMEMEMSSDEKELCDKYKPFMRYLPPGEHNALIRSVIQEQRTRKKIQELQDARSAGCRTLSEAKSFTDKKRKKEHLEALKANGGPKHPTQAKRPTNVAKSGGDSESGSPRSTVLDAKKGQLDSPSGSGSSARSSWEDWDLTGIQGADLLSPAEHVMCCQYRILPVHFLKMQEIMVQEIFKGTLLKQSDAHSLFNMEPAKVDRVYEMVIKKVGQPEESAVV